MGFGARTEFQVVVFLSFSCGCSLPPLLFHAPCFSLWAFFSCNKAAHQQTITPARRHKGCYSSIATVTCRKFRATRGCAWAQDSRVSRESGWLQKVRASDESATLARGRCRMDVAWLTPIDSRGFYCRRK